MRPDIELDVSALPQGRKSPLAAYLLVHVQADGTIADCASSPVENLRPDQQATPQLIAIACAEARNGWNPIVATDSSGAPHSSVQNLFVQFRLAKNR